MTSCFITGTSTDVGKTFFANLLVRALRAAGVDAVGMKPVACGDNADTKVLSAAARHVEPDGVVTPIHLQTAASPLTASVLEDRVIDKDLILSTYRDLRGRHEAVIVEGVGGWMVPLLPDFFVADLAAAMELPVIIVAENVLGALNHTLLTLESVQRRGIQCGGIVFNNRHTSDSIPAKSNRSILELLITVPILFELHPGQQSLDLAHSAFNAGK